VLRSRTLAREIVPRVTTAVFGGSVGYRFLSALAGQDGAGIRWSWGSLADAAFLPRVRAGDVVLSRARWVTTPDQLFAPHLRMPRWVVIAEDDMDLPIDRDNPLARAMLDRWVRSRDRVAIEEMYPPPDELAVRGADGAYAHELSIMFAHEGAPAPEIVVPASAAVTADRTMLPGGPWLYLKAYTGEALVNGVLCELADVLHAETGWFWLRYADPDPHLRLRIPRSNALPALMARLEPLVADGVVQRVQVDTYEREIERYGGFAGVALAERIFAADSAAVLAMVEVYPGDDGIAALRQLAALGVDRLLDDLGVTDKLGLYTAMRDRLGAERGMTTAMQKELGVAFRRERDALASLLSGRADDVLSEGVAALEQRSEALRPLAAELASLFAKGELAVPIPELARSFVHMHANRMLAISPRMQELALYDMLRRHHAAEHARSR
jgi:thiopeptide-type bacteriocin biosynthesis protein